jgi:tetratricopeptide (TPR) repeat protein
MKEIKKIIILFFWAVGVAIGQQEFEIGEAYFKQGEFDKAAAVYKKLAGNKQQANAIHEHYFVSLLKLKDFANAEKF